MQITQEQNNELLKELIRVTTKPALDSVHEITVAMLMKANGRTDRVCRYILENKILMEGWKKHTVIGHNGKATLAYYNPAKWNPEEA